MNILDFRPQKDTGVLRRWFVDTKQVIRFSYLKFALKLQKESDGLFDMSDETLRKFAKDISDPKIESTAGSLDYLWRYLRANHIDFFPRDIYEVEPDLPTPLTKEVLGFHRTSVDIQSRVGAKWHAPTEMKDYLMRLIGDGANTSSTDVWKANKSKFPGRFTLYESVYASKGANSKREIVSMQFDIHSKGFPFDVLWISEVLFKADNEHNIFLPGWSRTGILVEFDSHFVAMIRGSQSDFLKYMVFDDIIPNEATGQIDFIGGLSLETGPLSGMRSTRFVLKRTESDTGTFGRISQQELDGAVLSYINANW